MDFLSTAMYYVDTAGNMSNNLYGVLLTRFDEADLTARAYMEFCDTERLRTDNTVKPCGFKLDDDGMLLSDTITRREVPGELFTYVTHEIAKDNRGKSGLVDVVMCAMACGGVVVANYQNYIEEGSKPILVEMANFRVSNSTLNVYAPYLVDGERFRSFSLVDITENKANSFVLGIPREREDEFEYVKRWCTAVNPGDDTVLNGDYYLYRVDAPLLGFNSFVGEAFLNYLASNVAYYTVGLKVIKEMLAESSFIAPRETEERSARKKPMGNVAIEMPVKDIMLPEVLDALDKRQKLEDLLQTSVPARFTYFWVDSIFKEAVRLGGDNFSSNIPAACVSLRYQCKREYLHYALELLSHRLYIWNLGPGLDPCGAILKGGGVLGNAIKRVSW